MITCLLSGISFGLLYCWFIGYIALLSKTKKKGLQMQSPFCVELCNRKKLGKALSKGICFLVHYNFAFDSLLLLKTLFVFLFLNLNLKGVNALVDSLLKCVACLLCMK